MTPRTIGVLGGMGPASTHDLCLRITRNTPAETDQDHIPVVVFNNPRIPSRVDALVNDGPSPLSELIRTAKVLQDAGADFLVMPCNSAHHYHGAIAEAVKVPFVHIVEVTKKEIEANEGRSACVGLLAARPTLMSRVYEAWFDGLVLPTEMAQAEWVDDAIFGEAGIKRGHIEGPRRRLRQAAQALIDSGATVVIAGCTEIPLVLGPDDVTVPLINPNEILARTAVSLALT